MALLPSINDYTDLDFDAARRRLFDLVRSKRPDWTDESVASFANLLLEMNAHEVDVIAYMVNAAQRESYVGTAQRRESMVALGRSVGYELATASAAQASVTFSLAAPAASDVVIPAETVVRTRDRLSVVRFRLLAAATIDAGETTVTATVEHSERQTKTSASTGLANASLYLDLGPYLDGSVVLTTTGDGAWTEVDSLLSSTATDKHYTVTVDSSDRATVRFGDGVTGKIPTGTISVVYRTGGGVAGNVVAGALSVAEGTFVDVGGLTVQVSVTNPAAASGGANRESLEVARLRIPQSLRTAGGRSITREDYELNALAVPGVARALMVTSNEDPAVGENAGIIYVVPAGGGTATDELLDDVVEMVTVTRPGPPTFAVAAVTAVYLPIDVSVRATFATGASPSAVAAQIRATLTDFFAPSLANGTPNEAVGFGLEVGGVLAWSDLFNAVRDLSGVRKIQPFDFTLNGSAADVNLANREFVTLGDVSVTDAATGLPV